MDIIKESNILLLSVAYSTRSVETVSIQRLPVFLSAAEHLNFTRAAEEQCISQTAVSQQIKLLEQELGYALFVRGKRGVSLTPAGEVFYRQCRQLMIRYNGAAAQGKKVALGNATDLRIGYAGAYELWTIVSQIRKYHRQHPEAEIEFQLGSNQSLLGALAEGQLDMAVLSGFGVELGKELDSRVTLSDPCMVMISASHPLAAKKEIHPRELKGMPIVLNRAQDSQPSAGLIAGMYANMGLRENKRMYADDFYSIALIINTGIAGAVHHDLKVLDVVISRELCYHDFNARFLCDYPPYIDGIHASELMVESAVEAFQQIDHGSSCCFVGKIATGDQFIESAEVKNKIVEEHHPMCVEMEGAAIGHTCCVNDIPFVIIRTMSDNADEEAAESATNFEETAARHSAGIVMQMLSSAR